MSPGGSKGHERLGLPICQTLATPSAKSKCPHGLVRLSSPDSLRGTRHWAQSTEMARGWTDLSDRQRQGQSCTCVFEDTVCLLGIH